MTPQQTLLKITSQVPTEKILSTLEQADVIRFPIKFNTNKINPIKFENNKKVVVK